MLVGVVVMLVAWRRAAVTTPVVQVSS